MDGGFRKWFVIFIISCYLIDNPAVLCPQSPLLILEPAHRIWLEVMKTLNEESECVYIDCRKTMRTLPGNGRKAGVRNEREVKGEERFSFGDEDICCLPECYLNISNYCLSNKRS